MENLVSIDFLVLSVSHLWLRQSLAEYLEVGLKSNILEMRSFASSEILSHSSSGKTYLPVLILLRISLSVSPLKGGYPHSRIYIMTPQLQTSHFSSYFSKRTSG